MDYRRILILYVIYAASTYPDHVSMKSQDIDISLRIWGE